MSTTPEALPLHIMHRIVRTEPLVRIRTMSTEDALDLFVSHLGCDVHVERHPIHIGHLVISGDAQRHFFLAHAPHMLKAAVAETLDLGLEIHMSFGGSFVFAKTTFAACAPGMCLVTEYALGRPRHNLSRELHAAAL